MWRGPLLLFHFDRFDPPRLTVAWARFHFFRRLLYRVLE